MKERTGSTGLLPEEGNGLLARHGPTQTRNGFAKRDWFSLGKFTNVLFFFVLLGSGILMGVVVSLHVMGYFKESVYVEPLDRPSGGNSFRDFVKPSTPTQFWVTPGGFFHAMSDEELMWRASIVPHRPGFPVERPKKIAFMFLTKGPLPLRDLWERYFNGHKGKYSIYVHPHPAYKLDVPKSSVFHRRQIPSEVRFFSFFLFLVAYLCSHLQFISASGF
jgi:hypothetical protein